MKKKLLLPLLLFAYFLIKIGQIPLFLFKLALFLKKTFILKKPGRPSRKETFNRYFPLSLRIGLGLFFLVLLVFIYSYFLIIVAHTLPSPDRLSTLEGPQTTTFYDRDGRLLYRLYEGRNRTLVGLEELPIHLIQATIAIEDKHFYNHPGIDFFAITRAAVANIKGEKVQGGSTITQQLIKNTLLTPERTFQRKIKEILLAYWAERIFSKKEILQMYFNESPYGGTAWGIEAASQVYFNKKASQLSLAESAFLAGLPASPTEYSPFGPFPELAKKRQKEVLKRMVEDGYITKEQAEIASSEELTFNSPNNHIKAPHFVMYVRSLLAQKYGEKTVSQGGLSIVTTIDLDIQQMAEQVVAEEVAKLQSLNVTNGAAMITDAKTGQILAMVGSRDYFDPKIGNFNVTLAPRQPGSSIKPITYATAFKQGYTPGNMLLDTPTVFKNSWETYAPVNYDGKFHGPVTIRTALGSSYNVPAVKMLYIIGIPNMIQTAKDLGITTFNDLGRYGLSLTLGGGEVKLIDMMVVFGTFSQNGVKHNSVAVLRVTDGKGNIIENNSQVSGVRVLAEGVAFMITSILMDNKAREAAFGPNSLLNIPGHQVAVKTGTTDSKRDNLTFGYTSEFVVGVWVGNNDNSIMHRSLTSGVTGAAPIWNKLMTNMLYEREPVSFVRPSEVGEGVVDGKRDLVLTGQPTKSVIKYGRKKDEKDQNKENITFQDPFTTFTQDTNPPKTP